MARGRSGGVDGAYDQVPRLHVGGAIRLHVLGVGRLERRADRLAACGVKPALDKMQVLARESVSAQDELVGQRGQRLVVLRVVLVVATVLVHDGGERKEGDSRAPSVSAAAAPIAGAAAASCSCQLSCQLQREISGSRWQLTLQRREDTLASTLSTHSGTRYSLDEAHLPNEIVLACYLPPAVNIRCRLAYEYLSVHSISRLHPSMECCGGLV